MANAEHLAILKLGLKEWNEWREEDPEISPDLSGIDLSRFDFSKANLFRVNFSGTKLVRADLSDAELADGDLSHACLTQATLDGAALTRTNLASADLTKSSVIGAQMQQADLSGADLRGAELGEANFSESKLDGTDFGAAFADATVFANVDLSVAKGLETVRHFGPSTIGVDTIYKSKGKIPEVFLRGCGLPEEFIAYIGSMVGRPIEYYSCFISYSTKDQAFADRLYADLQAKGVRCWFAPHDIMGGRKIHEQIDEAIRMHDKLLLILSEHSMASDWVGTEIANARERESREKKQMLFPITIAPFEEVRKWKKFDADLGSDSAKAVREYYIPDFSGWDGDHAGYQREFEKLVGALKAVFSG